MAIAMAVSLAARGIGEDTKSGKRYACYAERGHRGYIKLLD